MIFLNPTKLPKTGLPSIGQTGQKCPPGPPTPGTAAALCSDLQSLHVATLLYATEVADRVELLACGGMLAIEYIQPGIDRVKIISTGWMYSHQGSIESVLLYQPHLWRRAVWPHAATACHFKNLIHPCVPI